MCPEVSMVVCVHHGPNVPLGSFVVLSAKQCIAVPLAQSIGYKMLAELDDSNGVFVMAFMAYMDPSEYLAVDIWLM